MTGAVDKKILDELNALRETIKQISYQNEMMLRWVNGAVITVDREGKVLGANDVALASLGWSEEEFIGRHMHDTMHHSQDDGSEYPWDFCPTFAAIEDGSSHHVDGDVFWKKNGSSFSADYIVCPTRDENSEITGAILTFRNITELKLRESKRIHSMKLVAIGELSAGIAHEINTPIQFIGSNISFLSDSFQDLFALIESYQKLTATCKAQGLLPEVVESLEQEAENLDLPYIAEEIPKAFEQTQHGVERVTELVLGLKGFAHSGSDDKKISSDLNAIINNALIVCRNAYKYVSELEVQLEELPMLNVVPGDIGQVIINLVVNAAQAIEEKRRKTDPLGKITVRSFRDGDDAVIEVEDTGGGIPEGIRERIFDPFFTTKEVGRGSGQGLAISHTIICDKHNGDLTFQSRLGEGTTFIIRLPVSR